MTVLPLAARFLPALSSAHISPSTQPALFFFFNDTATTEIYTLSLHDALPISCPGAREESAPRCASAAIRRSWAWRSEEHTSELQSHSDLVCRLLLEKKKEHPHEPPACYSAPGDPASADTALTREVGGTLISNP